MRIGRYLWLAILLAGPSAPAAQCWTEIVSHLWSDLLELAVDNVEDRAAYTSDLPWDRKRFETVMGQTAQRVGKPRVHLSLYQAYRALTGTTLDVNPALELSDYLESLGIEPRELVHLDGGVQGHLFVHPKLGNKLLKVLTSSVQASGFTSVGENGSIPLGQNRLLKMCRLGNSLENLRAEVTKDVEPDSPFKRFAPQMEARIKKAFLTNAKEALHLSRTLILPAIISAQADTKYFDFARVYVIGNGFFVREYYADAKVKNPTAAVELLASKAMGNPELRAELDRVTAHFPVLFELFGKLVYEVPSYFTYPPLYEERRQRVFSIFDID